MRAFLDRNKWVTYLVVGFFLLATSGTAISRMTCLQGGHSVLSLGLATDCCPEEAPQGQSPEVKPVCCELAMVQGERDNYLPNNGDDLIVPELVWHGSLVQLIGPKPARSITWLGSRPPPLSAPDRLATLSVQRV